MVDRRLFQSAAEFTDAAITFIDDDGYPFSMPISSEVNAEKGLVKFVKNPNLPSLAGREVGIIFNHVTPLPGGGYTDRRYIVFWGTLCEEGADYVLEPVKGFTWNEKDVPFFQYSEMSVPQARRYLDRLKEKPWLSAPWLIIRTFRLPFVVATILPVSLGAAIAYRAGTFDWMLFALTLAGALFIHLGVNTANDYFDARSGADDINITPTPYSGGSRIIQYGLLTQGTILSLSTGAYIAGSAIGLYLAMVRGWPILVIGLLGLLVSYGYTAPPLKLAYRGVGELGVAVGFGPLLVLGSYFVQAQTVSLEAFLASLPVGLLVLLILYVNEIPDRTWDDEAEKKTLVATLSEQSIPKVFTLAVGGVYLVLVLGAAARIFPVTVIAGLLTIPLALRVRKLIQANIGNPYGLMPAMSNNIKLYVYTASLMVAGYLLAVLI